MAGEIELDKIYNMNCLDGLKQLDNNFIDLTITSPPYDNLRSYKEYSFDFESIAKELYRVTKKGGVIVWVIGDAVINGSETGTSFKQALYFKEIGFRLHDTMIYQKNNIRPLTHNRYEQEFEYMFVFSKGKPNTFNPIKKSCVKKPKKDIFLVRNKDDTIENRIIKRQQNRIIGNVWKFDIGYNLSTKEDIAFQHPAIFPEKLVEDHIISWSNPDDIILDPFVGSGTTCKMAKYLNRYFIGFEISKEYCYIANTRLKIICNIDDWL